MDDLLKEFLVETNESLGQLDNQLVELERHPNDKDLLGSIFRIVHTIKGTCGFLGLPRLESVAHAGENVLGKFRDGALQVNADGVSVILQCFDRIKEILTVLEETGTEPAGEDGELINRLNTVAAGKSLSGSGNSASAPAAAPAPKAEPKPEPKLEIVEGAPMGDSAELQALFDSTPGPAAPAVVATAPVPAKDDKKTTTPAVAGAGGNAAAAEATSLRVNVNVLEDLMNLVSELVLTRNQLMQILRGTKESEFTLPVQRLSHITTDLQEGVMKTRMQPVGNAWQKLPRIIRDLSLELNKKIDLQMVGAETELDRQVLDMIKDPLTHMVRNSADHGIETPDVRVAAGKPETGQIILNAFHEGGHILIEISDDGKGLNLERIKEKALENGLHTADELANMSDKQVMQLIFRAGFSTAQKVTAVSGRGVGMDVVKTNIEKIGGTVDMTSVAGKGSKFTIKIPLTLAIVSALIVDSCGEKFAIPQLSVVELVRVTKKSEFRIEEIRGAPVLRLRNHLLPLISLQRLLRLDELMSQDAIQEQKKESADPLRLDNRYIVVCKVANFSFGIIVDEVFDTEEIVVKPVAPILRNLSLFSGNTILGDGTVIMILDPNGIAESAGDVMMHEEERDADAEKQRRLSSENRVSLLLFNAGSGGPKAVPLSLVARLEDIKAEDVEYSDGRAMIQYREKLMPLILFDNKQELKKTGHTPLIVFSDGERSMGLVIDQIVDIVEDHIKSDLSSTSENVLGSTVIAGKATDIINVSYYLERAFGDWFKRTGVFDADAQKTVNQARRLLLVDDSAFFRNLIVPSLSVAGFDVRSVESGQQALDLADKGEDFDVIVSDIEMPNMSGLNLVQRLRQGSPWKDKPIVALSSLAGDEDVRRGLAAGFDKYLAKTDRGKLIREIKDLLETSSHNTTTDKITA